MILALLVDLIHTKPVEFPPSLSVDNLVFGGLALVFFLLGKPQNVFGQIFVVFMHVVVQVGLL
jgi:hypothetical protein